MPFQELYDLFMSFMIPLVLFASVFGIAALVRNTFKWINNKLEDRLYKLSELQLFECTTPKYPVHYDAEEDVFFYEEDKCCFYCKMTSRIYTVILHKAMECGELQGSSKMYKSIDRCVEERNKYFKNKQS